MPAKNREDRIKELCRQILTLNEESEQFIPVSMELQKLLVEHRKELREKQRRERRRENGHDNGHEQHSP